MTPVPFRLKAAVFILLALACLLPAATAAMALVAGIAFSLTLGNPFPAQVKKLQTVLLQACVMGLGAGTQLTVIARVGAQGVGQTLLTLSTTLGATWLLAKVLQTERTTSLLIGVGTAICGGSAIAAAGPVVGAKSTQLSISLAVVFLLNAAALVLFPPIGHWAGLSAEAFGLWSALAIHDTSSVVGASMQFGEHALAVGTTVKLARALWIVPLTLLLARFWPRGDDAAEPKGKMKLPWFIVGFIAAAATVTYVPGLNGVGLQVASAARKLLVLTLFLVGAGVSREALKSVGGRPLLLGGVLWVLVASTTLVMIRQGWLT
ncbi:MAG: YeiH family protein [Myxococcaceae bacterium]|nr:YeiH family protein [Myxococcaceae bacterium]